MIFVIGNLRSGTSRIAESLHQDFCVHMGRAFPAQPVGPHQRADWEELTLAVETMDAHQKGLGISQVWMEDYCKMRASWIKPIQAAMVLPIPTWGAKNCVLTRYVDALPADAFVILANRPLEEANASARRWMKYHVPGVIDEILKLQQELDSHMDAAKARADLVIDYSQSMDRVRKRLRTAVEAN